MEQYITAKKSCGDFVQISSERCEPFASGGVSFSGRAVWSFRINGAFGFYV